MVGSTPSGSRARREAASAISTDRSSSRKRALGAEHAMRELTPSSGGASGILDAMVFAFRLADLVRRP
jgi:hypothetical protein